MLSCFIYQISYYIIYYFIHYIILALYSYYIILALFAALYFIHNKWRRRSLRHLVVLSYFL